VNTKQSLLDQLRKLRINSGGTLLVHSSMKAVGECEGGADTVLDALMELMQDGLLVLPTHTWSDENNKEGIFDPLTEPACVGILPNLFLRRPNVIRSLHPTHSVAAAGKDAYDFIEGEEKATTPCPRNGCYGKLYDRKSQILFLGCTLKSNTIIHGVEEWNEIPDRLAAEKKQIIIRRHNGETFLHATHHHYCSTGNVSLNYDILEEPLLKTGILTTGYVGKAFSYLADCKQMCDLTTAFLKRKPHLFSTRDPIPEDWMDES
jgi:aminoglycoside 3-N-acetyltransferase